MLLQETHSTPGDEVLWKREWGGDVYFSHGSSKSKGVAILIPPNADVKLNFSHVDPEGRYIIADIEYFNVNYIIGNIYAPTQDKEKEQIVLIDLLSNILAGIDAANIVFGGDFNIIMNPLLDKKGGNISRLSSLKYRSHLNAFLETYDLYDIWRLKHENISKFTWRCKKKRIYSRLDYFFISEHLCNTVASVDIVPCIFSDHSLLTLSLINPSQQARGPGYWKFNTTLLRDKNYTDMIKQTIQQSEKHHHNEDKTLVWDLVKMDIRTHTIRYSKFKKRENIKYEQTLESELKQLHDSVEHVNNIVELQDRINAIERELLSIVNKRTAGIIMRSKAQWAEEGEKSSSYFLNLEKKNYLNKCISRIHVEGNIITDPDEILLEEKNYIPNSMLIMLVLMRIWKS